MLPVGDRNAAEVAVSRGSCVTAGDAVSVVVVVVGADDVLLVEGADDVLLVAVVADDPLDELPHAANRTASAIAPATADADLGLDPRFLFIGNGVNSSRRPR